MLQRNRQFYFCSFLRHDCCSSGHGVLDALYDHLLIFLIGMGENGREGNLRAGVHGLGVPLYHFFIMYLFVAFSFVRTGKPTSTFLTGEGFFAGVGTYVGSKVIGAGETAETDVTLERFLAGVDSKVTGELVRAGEPLAAILDRTLVGLFGWRLLLGFHLFGGIAGVGLVL